MIRLTRPACPNPTALATNYKQADNKKALMEASFGKCMYCESKVETVSFGDVEHIKPKSKYPKQKFEWENLGIVCTRCNNSKSDQYDENCEIINPYSENPSDYLFAAGHIMFSIKGNQRAELTLLTADLNRASLIEARREKISRVDSAVKACFRTQNQTLQSQLLAALKNEADEDREYSLAVKHFLDLQNIA